MKLNFNGFYTLNPFYNMSDIDETIGSDYYFVSNDIIKFSRPTFFNKMSMILNDKYKHVRRSANQYRYDNSSFVAIGNIHSIHALSLFSNSFKFRKLIFIDYNKNQILHLRKCIDDILRSYSRTDFIERFFCLKLNEKSRKILENIKFPSAYVHGEVNSDKNFISEKEFWSNVEFDSAQFRKKYNLFAEETEVGIEIKSNTIGDINKYKATLFSCGMQDHGMHVFTLAFGSGFLASEREFFRLQELLNKTPTCFIVDDISIVFEDILSSLRYSPICIWLSNIMHDYFIRKSDTLNRIKDIIYKYSHNEGLPEYEISILQDNRVPRWIPLPFTEKNIYQRNFSVHTNTFSTIDNLIHGNTLEVVNMEKWIEEDNGISKLNQTEYMLSNNFINCKTYYDSIFFHILLGHGEDKESFFNLCNHARKLTKNFIILEHYIKSNDFAGSAIGSTPEEIQQILGRASRIEFIPGQKSLDRNFVLQFICKRNVK